MPPKFIKLTYADSGAAIYVNAAHVQGFYQKEGRTILFEPSSKDSIAEVTETPSEILALIEKPCDARRDIEEAIKWNERQTFQEATDQTKEDNAN